jgi:hypothetical protein
VTNELEIEVQLTLERLSKSVRFLGFVLLPSIASLRENMDSRFLISEIKFPRSRRN